MDNESVTLNCPIQIDDANEKNNDANELIMIRTINKTTVFLGTQNGFSVVDSDMDPVTHIHMFTTTTAGYSPNNRRDADTM